MSDFREKNDAFKVRVLAQVLFKRFIIQGPVPERRNNSIPGINVPYFRDNFIPRINSVPKEGIALIRE